MTRRFLAVRRCAYALPRGLTFAFALTTQAILLGCSEGYPTDDLKPDPRTHAPTQTDIVQALNETGRSPSAQGRWTYRFQSPCSVAVSHASQAWGESQRVVDLKDQSLEVQSKDGAHSVILIPKDAEKERQSVVFVGQSRVSAMDVHSWIRRLRGTCVAIGAPARAGA
jgi:hypothetical protein